MPDYMIKYSIIKCVVMYKKLPWLFDIMKETKLTGLVFFECWSKTNFHAMDIILHDLSYVYTYTQ